MQNNRHRWGIYHKRDAETGTEVWQRCHKCPCQRWSLYVPYRGHVMGKRAASWFVDAAGNPVTKLPRCS